MVWRSSRSVFEVSRLSDSSRSIGAERAATFVSIGRQSACAARRPRSSERQLHGDGRRRRRALANVLAYARGAGVDARWAVIKGNPRFFEITKRIHNHLYGTPGDGGPLGGGECRDYEDTTGSNADELVSLIRPGDVVVLHDPQTAGLVPDRPRPRRSVVWRCHVGRGRPERVLRAGLGLSPAVPRSCRRLRLLVCALCAGVDGARSACVIAPSIDPFSAKNEPIEPADVLQTLRRAGLLANNGPAPDSEFTRRDGTKGRVQRASIRSERRRTTSRRADSCCRPPAGTR